MAELHLNINTRDEKGSNAVRKLRREDKIPGIFYHHGTENIPFYVDRKELHNVWGHESSLLDVTFDGKDNKKCIIRDIQFDPIKGRPIHIDLLGIKMTEKITVSVPIELVGTSTGVKNSGGILQQILREIQLECLPSDIPENIEIDVSDLDIGDNLQVSDLVAEKVEILDDPDSIVATVTAPRLVVEEEEEEGLEEEEAAEPEVVSQRSEEEED